MPVKLIISVAPVFNRRGKPMSGLVEARFGDELLFRVTSEPLLDGARKLIELGHDPGAVVHLVRTDRPHVVAMKARLGTRPRGPRLLSALRSLEGHFPRQRPRAHAFKSGGPIPAYPACPNASMTKVSP